MIRLTAKNREFNMAEPIPTATLPTVVDPMVAQPAPVVYNNPASFGADFNFELLVREYVPTRLRSIEQELQSLDERSRILREEVAMLERVNAAVGIF